MIFRQLFEQQTSTYTYLLGDEATRRAVLIDPVVEEAERYVALVEELDLKLLYTLETHVHADHVTAADTLRGRLGSKGVIHRNAQSSCADLQISAGVILQVGSLEFEARETPGHTSSCVSYVMRDRVFTGDTLLIGGCGRTDFQQGDPATLYQSVHAQLFTLPDETLVYPGHDYSGNWVSTIGQEKAKNSRLGADKSKAEFIEIMKNLKLAYPKQIDRALPANQTCGREQALNQG